MNAITGSTIEYTKSGWMTAEVFKKFLDHFNKHAGPERPVVLLIDSVAVENQIELYRIVPNATHLIQPLDKGVFGPLRTAWHQVTRRHYREIQRSRLIVATLQRSYVKLIYSSITTVCG